MTHGALPDPDDPTPGAHIHGWMAPIELRWLGARAAEMESIAEIGSLRGRSAFALLTACPGPVYCIDPWDDDAGHCLPAFMEACGHFPNVRPIQARSLDVATDPNMPDIDMVFLDGDHEYESVEADIAAWLPKTKRLLCGHDYYVPIEHAGFPGVPRAVQETFGEDVKIGEGTSIWYAEL